MPAAILTQDLLGMCLYIGNGNVNISLEHLIQRFESFQEKYNRHFGISICDLRFLFYWLIVQELELKKELEQVRLVEIMFEMLRYRNVYFNDEGEHWSRKDFVLPDAHRAELLRYRDPTYCGNGVYGTRLGYNFEPDPILNYEWSCVSFYAYEKHEIPGKFDMKQKLNDFLSDSKNHTPYAIMDFLPTIQVSESLLFRCSRPGQSS
jgi:hypothetical protein